MQGPFSSPAKFYIPVPLNSLKAVKSVGIRRLAGLFHEFSPREKNFLKKFDLERGKSPFLLYTLI